MQTTSVNLSEILSARQFNHESAVIPDKIYLTIENEMSDSSIIGTASNFVAITGLPKTAKSSFVGAIISSFLIQRPVLSFRAHAYKEKFKIALFDTEQSNFDFDRTVKRIENYTQYDRKGVFKFFDAFLLREDDSITILKLINEYLKNTPECAILIIDGLLDLIENMNDEAASKRLIRILKKWGKKHDILIITVLHLGKKDQSSIGHIGSASDRYAQSTLIIEKTKDQTYTCNPKFLRSAKDFDTIEIKYSNERGIFAQVNK